MKVLLLDGSPKANGNTAYALSQMAEVFTAEGVETEILHVGNQPSVAASPAEAAGRPASAFLTTRSIRRRKRFVRPMVWWPPARSIMLPQMLRWWRFWIGCFTAPALTSG